MTEDTRPTLGVLMLKTRFPRPSGDVGAPETWHGRTIFRTVPQATVSSVVRNIDIEHQVSEQMVAAARALEAEGAQLITTSCGFLAPLQGTLQCAVRVPVVASALALVPLLRAVFGPGAPLGVLTFDARTLGPRHFGPWWDESLVIEGVEGGRELHRVISNDLPELDLHLAEADVIAAAQRIVARRPDVPALVMECTNFPPYRAAVARAAARPVFDLVGLVHWMLDGLPPAVAVPGALQRPSRLLDCRDQNLATKEIQGES